MKIQKATLPGSSLNVYAVHHAPITPDDEAEWYFSAVPGDVNAWLWLDDNLVEVAIDHRDDSETCARWEAAPLFKAAAWVRADLQSRARDGAHPYQRQATLEVYRSEYEHGGKRVRVETDPGLLCRDLLARVETGAESAESAKEWWDQWGARWHNAECAVAEAIIDGRLQGGEEGLEEDPDFERTVHRREAVLASIAPRGD